jgi:large subunit ribosomal protein L6
MSRIGKKPVPLPSGVAVDVKDGIVKVKGPKGELSQHVDRAFAVKVEDGRLEVARPSDQKHHRSLHGLYRALLNNMVVGVTEGFTRTLEIEGVGYGAKLEGSNKLILNIGFNAPVVMEAPAGVTVACPKPTIISITGSDKQVVGQFAANVRRVRPPEPYKGKGIRYQGEHIRRKAGKAIGGKS